MKKFVDAPFLPTEVEIEQITENSARISAFPFESGYAITLAHPLRRLLMSSSVGYAPIAVKVEGAKHEFDSIRGMLEDIAIFIINLKELRFKIKDNSEQIQLNYSFSNAREIKGCDLTNDAVEVINGENHLATINSDCTLNFSIIVQKSIGYVPSEDLRDLIPFDFIPIDAFFTPVRKVTYDIEKMLLEDNPNYEKAIFTVTTDGQISPINAFKEAITTMYSQISVFNKVFDLSEVKIVEVNQTQNTIDLKDLIVKIEDLNLSARSFNSLDRAGIRFVGNLALMSKVEVESIKNLGKKSLEEISDKFTEIGFPISGSLDEETASALRKKLEQLKA